jgi:hypothetical protein
VSNLQLSFCSGCYFIANLAKIDQTKFLSLFWLIPSHILRLNWPIPTYFLLAGCIVSLFPISAPSTPFYQVRKKYRSFAYFFYCCRDFFGGYCIRTVGNSSLLKIYTLPNHTITIGVCILETQLLGLLYGGGAQRL